MKSAWAFCPKRRSQVERTSLGQPNFFGNGNFAAVKIDGTCFSIQPSTFCCTMHRSKLAAHTSIPIHLVSLSINQPINKTKQPISQPASQSTSQPTNPPTHPPTHQPTHQPINQPTHPPTNPQPTNQPTNPPTNQSTNPPTNQPTHQPTNQPTNQATNQSTNQSTSQQKNGKHRSIRHSVSQPVSQSVTHSINQSIHQSIQSINAECALQTCNSVVRSWYLAASPDRSWAARPYLWHDNVRQRLGTLVQLVGVIKFQLAGAGNRKKTKHEQRSPTTALPSHGHGKPGSKPVLPLV